ncbi:TetR/AcrR family transcriptional regulator [Actinoallomurus rhizosphaericola]|uniref:TetR/AcrR family transcriptional regulator n=1 Tax=Actinoallomurus rhizosphaericola TaxID=2952536 RepID=UPI002091490B|nr:TetR/AcrR family transcriptional regulator [Actinoallomurus rhizosphaericola]MCO5993564.1 TetR/AcrR family transcriptional regulator [Actinoallomurus rhizosphaericola]
MAEPGEAVPSGRPRRTDAARNARALLTAARELFDERGPDVALDEVARRAGVGNATLYRHFPTRSELIVAVYADEVETLCQKGAALIDAESAADALFAWLDDLVVHVATKRALAFAGTEPSVERRSVLFDQWHRSMRDTAQELLVRAQRSGDVNVGLTVDDVLALTNATAIAATGAQDARRLLRIMRHGFAGTQASPDETP